MSALGLALLLALCRCSLSDNLDSLQRSKDFSHFRYYTSAGNWTFDDHSLAHYNRLLSDRGHIRSPSFVVNYPICLSFKYLQRMSGGIKVIQVFEVTNKNHTLDSLWTSDAFYGLQQWDTLSVTLALSSGSLSHILFEVEKGHLYFEVFAIADISATRGRCSQTRKAKGPSLTFFCTGDEAAKYIAQYKVCDGVADCESGEDEKICPGKKCNSIFCPGTGGFETCLNYSSPLICNGHADCENGVDEDPKLCDGHQFCADKTNQNFCSSGNCEVFPAARGQTRARCSCRSGTYGNRCQFLEVQEVLTSSTSWLKPDHNASYNYLGVLFFIGIIFLGIVAVMLVVMIGRTVQYRKDHLEQLKSFVENFTSQQAAPSSQSTNAKAV